MKTKDSKAPNSPSLSLSDFQKFAAELVNLEKRSSSQPMAAPRIVRLESLTEDPGKNSSHLREVSKSSTDEGE